MKPTPDDPRVGVTADAIHVSGGGAPTNEVRCQNCGWQFTAAPGATSCKCVNCNSDVKLTSTSFARGA